MTLLRHFLDRKVPHIVKTEVFLHGSTFRIGELNIYLRLEMREDLVDIGQPRDHFGSHRFVFSQLLHQ